MATNIEAIAEFLRAEALEFKHLDGKQLIHTGFGMDTYVDPKAHPELTILISLEEDGKYLILMAPFCYICAKIERYPAVLRACDEAMKMFKMVRFVLNPEDGRVAAEVHLPLEDAELTHQQFVRALGGLPLIIERVDPIFREAIETGEPVRLTNLPHSDWLM